MCSLTLVLSDEETEQPFQPFLFLVSFACIFITIGLQFFILYNWYLEDSAKIFTWTSVFNISLLLYLTIVYSSLLFSVMDHGTEMGDATVYLFLQVIRNLFIFIILVFLLSIAKLIYGLL